MTEFLIVQIRLGRITLEQVPEKYKATVEVALQNEEIS